MGKTITEKIFSKAAVRDVSAGEYVKVGSRLPFTLGGGLGRGPRQAMQAGATRVFDPKLVRMVDGHFGSTASHHAGEGRAQGRAWAKRMGIPNENLYDLGRSGVEHVVACENAWALPGELFFQSTNGHTTTLGALGAFAVTMSYESGAYITTGKSWIRVPESVKVVVNGKRREGVFGRDVVEYILGQMGPSSAVGKVLEWTGPVIDDLSIDARFSICCQALFFGAWTAIVNPDRKCIDYVKARNSEPFEPLVSDPDASYAKVYEFDISAVEPQVTPPPERYHVSPVTKAAGKPVNRVFVGSCANGRIEDMRLVAQVLKGRKIHPDVIFNITPATPKIMKQCIEEGLLETFVEAEAVIPSPCCGMCGGLNMPLAKGDVCVSTSTCNYPGRMGSEEAEIYLANPATAAASAIEGKIADPRKYL